VPVALTSAEVIDLAGSVDWRWITGVKSIGPKPDSRPRLEGAHYKCLASCLCLLTPRHPPHTRTHHQPDSSPPGLAQWACYIKASAYGCRVGWTPARTIHTCIPVNIQKVYIFYCCILKVNIMKLLYIEWLSCVGGHVLCLSSNLMPMSLPSCCPNVRMLLMPRYDCTIAVMLLCYVEQSHVYCCRWHRRWVSSWRMHIVKESKICDFVVICCWCNNGRLISNVICGLYHYLHYNFTNLICCSPLSVTAATTTTILRPFFRDHPGEPVPEENYWTFWWKGRPTEAYTDHPAGRTPSGPTNAHLHHPPIFYRPDALPAAQPTVNFIKFALILTHCEVTTLLMWCRHHGMQSRNLLVFWPLPW